MKSRKVAIFFFAVSDSSICPDIGTSWCHSGIIEHFEIWGFENDPIGLQWGSKIKSAWILFKSVSDHPRLLKRSKNIIGMRLMVPTFSDLKGQRLDIRLYRYKKIKLLRFSWKLCQIVYLLESIQKKDWLHCLKCEVVEIRWKKGFCHRPNGDLLHFDGKTYKGDIGGSAKYSKFLVLLIMWSIFR